MFFDLNQVVPGLETLEFPGANYRRNPRAGPRQMELVRSVLQYSQTRPTDHVLEIGYGTASTLAALAFYTRSEKLIGVDPFPPPANAESVLGKRNIELVHGLFPDDPVAMEKVRANAPYAVIAALDSLKADPRVLQTSLPPLEHAKALFSLLAEGGVAVIMNDFNGRPYFSQSDARAAGLQVVRWGVRRPLPAAYLPLMPYDLRHRFAGVLNLVVLRRGQVRGDRVEAMRAKR